MNKIWSRRSVLIGLVAFSGVGAVSCLVLHKVSLATLFGIGVIVGLHRLTQLADATLTAQERRNREERQKYLLENSVSGDLRRLLGPRAYKAVIVAGVALLGAYFAWIDFFTK